MRPLMRMLPVPADLHPWVEAAVCVRAPASLVCSRFPALAGGMLVLRLSGHVQRDDGLALPRCTLLGANPRPVSYLHQGAVHAVGLVLWPHAVPVLAHADGCDLVQQAHDLPALLGPSACDLEAAAHDAEDDAARLQRLFDWVRRRVDNPRAEQRRLRLQHLALAAQGDRRAVTALGLSQRQLQRLCLHDLGLPPKQLQALQRLKATLHDGLRHPVPGAELALRHGFYDQSHLGRDLRRLAGASLRQLQAGLRNTAGPHWALAAGLSR